MNKFFICFLITAQTSIKNDSKNVCMKKKGSTRSGLVLSVSSLPLLQLCFFFAVNLLNRDRNELCMNGDDATKTEQI